MNSTKNTSKKALKKILKAVRGLSLKKISELFRYGKAWDAITKKTKFGICQND